MAAPGGVSRCCRGPLSARRGEDGGGGLAEALGEFDAVLAELSCPGGRSRCRYGELLERLKRRSSASASDGSSGLSDSEKSKNIRMVLEPCKAFKERLQDALHSDALLRELQAGADSLCRNSFSLSDEKLNSPTMSTPSLPSPSVTPCKAKLGDTKELEDYIADLDRTLASM